MSKKQSTMEKERQLGKFWRVINRIIDILIKNRDSHFDIKLLDNLYSFTLVLTVSRLDIPSAMAEYINSSHIKNYLYDKDISAELLDNKTDLDILHSC